MWERFVIFMDFKVRPISPVAVVLTLILIVSLSACQTRPKWKGSMLTHRENDSSRFAEIAKKKMREWEEYVSLIDDNKFDNDTLFRLTNEYFDANETLFGIKQDHYEKQLNLFNEGSLKIEPTEPVPYYSNFIERFKRIVEQSHYGAGADVIRYLLGYALYMQGETEDAISVFEDVINNYPWSRYYLEVSFRVGELYFSAEQYGLALDTYSVILKSPESIYYQKTLYKIAWIHYKLNEMEKSAQLFMKVISLGWSPGKTEGKLEGLIKESVSGVAMTLDHFSDFEKALDYLKTEGRKGYTALILESLGDRLLQATRFDEAIRLYRFYIDFIGTNTPSLPVVYKKMADLYDLIDREETSLEIKWEMVRQCNHTTSWYTKTYPNGSPEIDSLISKTIISISRRYQVRAKKSKNEEKLKRAIEGYKMFMNLFPKSEDYNEINALYAEALFDGKMFIEAAEEYRKTALLYEKGKKRTEILYSAFLTYRILFFQTANDTRKRDQNIKKSAVLFKDFKTELFKYGYMDKVLYKLVDMYVTVEKFNNAIDLIRPYTKGVNSDKALKKTAELHMLNGDLSAAEEVYTKVLEGSDEISLKKKLAKVTYAMAGDFLEAKKYEDAVKKFKKSFSVYPGYEIGESALLKLGDIYIKQDNFKELNSVVGTLLAEYPDSEGALSLLVKSAQEVEEKQPLVAAAFYEHASVIATFVKESQKLLLAAAYLFHREKKNAKAIEVYKRYLRFYDIPIEDKTDVLYKLGHLQIKVGRKDEGLRILRELLDLEKFVEKRIIGEIELLLLRDNFDNYRNIKLTQPFEETFRKKTEALASILKEYKQVASRKIPSLLPEVFFHMGMALEQFRDSIIQAEKPSELSEEEVEEYTFLLEEKAYPYDDKAFEVYKKSLSVANKYIIFNKWVRKTLNKLAEMRPALYKRELQELVVEPFFINPEPIALGKKE